MPAGLLMHVGCNREPGPSDISFAGRALRGGNLLSPPGNPETGSGIICLSAIRDSREWGRAQLYLSISFNPSFVSCGYMLEEFCEHNHCDQYTPSLGGSFAKCLMMQRELSRVTNCPLGYDKTGPTGTKK